MAYKSVQEIVRDLETRPAEETGHIYHPIPFPEFSHLKTSSNSRQTMARCEVIRRSLESLGPQRIAGMRVLDIGANAGYFTFALAKLGAEVTAFEPHPRYSTIGGFLASHSGLKVRWHGVPFRDDLIIGQRFDAALMLSVFQWLAEGGRRMREATAALRTVSEASRCLFFELGFNKGCSCLTTSCLNHYAELVAMLRTETAYQHFMLLKKTRPWAWQRRYLVLCSNDPRFEDSLPRRLQRGVRI